MARRYGSFPIILETYRECLNDWFDLPALRDVLRRVQSRELAVVEVETATASPFAGSLLFEYVATYMYEDDTPAAERRAQALTLDRDLLRELLGQEELRELIDAEALDALEADLQWRSERTRARNGDGLHDMLRRLGDLTEAEIAERLVEPDRAATLLEELRGERRAVPIRLAGSERWIAAEDAGRYRDGLGAMPPAGLPDAFLEPVPDALTGLIARYARGHGPFVARQVADRLGIAVDAATEAAERSRRATAPSCAARSARAPRAGSGATPRCCGGFAARAWPSPGVRSSRSRPRRSAASCPPGRGSIVRTRPPDPTRCGR